MQIDREGLRAQYRSMSDEELLSLDRGELTEIAQKCYDAEIAERELTPLEEDAHQPDLPAEGAEEAGMEPDWLETAEQACSFSAQQQAYYGEEAERACEALRMAGIPYHLDFEDPQGQQPGLLKIMVPSLLTLKATSVLDKEIFNEEFAETWRSHLQDLSEAQLRDLHPDAVCAGMLDRAARYRKIYQAEVARRAQIAGA